MFTQVVCLSTVGKEGLPTGEDMHPGGLGRHPPHGTTKAGGTHPAGMLSGLKRDFSTLKLLTAMLKISVTTSSFFRIILHVSRTVDAM